MKKERRTSRYLMRFGWILILLLILVVLWLHNVSSPGIEIEGCLTGCSESAVGRGEIMVVISLNMLHGFPDFDNLSARLDHLEDIITLLDPDIVLLQEVPRTGAVGNAAAALAERLGMNYVYYRANGNYKTIFFEEGEAVLSRFPLSNTAYKILEPNAGFFENRVVLKTTVETPEGEIDVYVTHLTNKDPDLNEMQAAALFEFVEKSETGIKIIGGDFNAQETSPQIMVLSQDWVDVYRTHRPDEPGYTCCFNRTGTVDLDELQKRIDYIFIDSDGQQNYEVIDTAVIPDHLMLNSNAGNWVSDHAGLILTLGKKNR